MTEHTVPPTTDYTTPPTIQQLFTLWMQAVPSAGPSERWDRETNFRQWAYDHNLIEGVGDNGKYVTVVTRYGGVKHLARPALFDERHFTTCSGTSSWTIEDWERHPDHPFLTTEAMRSLPSCVRCIKAARLLP